jgi:hypothetical protein
VDPSTVNQLLAGAATVTAAGITGYFTARYKTGKVEKKVDGQGQLALEILKLLKPNGGIASAKPTLYDKIEAIGALARASSDKSDKALAQLKTHCRKIDGIKGDVKALAEMLEEHDNARPRCRPDCECVKEAR